MRSPFSHASGNQTTKSVLWQHRPDLRPISTPPPRARSKTGSYTASQHHMGTWQLSCRSVKNTKKKKKCMYETGSFMFYITDTELYKNKEEFPVGGFNLVSFHSTNVTFIFSLGPSGGQVFLFQVRSGRRLCCMFNGKQENLFLKSISSWNVRGVLLIKHVQMKLKVFPWPIHYTSNVKRGCHVMCLLCLNTLHVTWRDVMLHNHQDPTC